MSDTLRTALLFLINTTFDLYLFILVIRLVLVFVHADYFNPLTQFVIKLTDVIVRPIKKGIPNVLRIESSTLLIIFILEMIKYALILMISIGELTITGLPILALADLLSLLIQTFTYAIILQVILSFVQPMSPWMYTLSRFTSPIMRPLDQLIPPIGGISITPIPALIILQLLNIILVNPLMMLGQSLTA